MNTLFLTWEHKFEDNNGYNFLIDLPRLENLRISSAKKNIDVSGVSACSNLKQLELLITPNPPLDLSNLHQLEYLSIMTTKNILGIELLSSLQRLSIDKFQAGEIDLSKLTNLRKFDAYSFKNSETLEPFANLKNLETISFENSKELTSLKGIETLPNLQVIELDSAPNLVDISAYSNHPGNLKLYVDGYLIYRQKDIPQDRVEFIINRWGKERIDTYFKPKKSRKNVEYEIGLGGVKQIEVDEE